MGALPTLRAATDPGVLGGQYYGPGGFFGARGYPKLAQSSGQSHDTAIQRRLWTVSEELTGVTFPGAVTLDGSIEESFRRRLDALPAQTG
jgi:hypothetical protein